MSGEIEAERGWKTTHESKSERWGQKSEEDKERVTLGKLSAPSGSICRHIYTPAARSSP